LHISFFQALRCYPLPTDIKSTASLKYIGTAFAYNKIVAKKEEKMKRFLLLLFLSLFFFWGCGTSNTYVKKQTIDPKIFNTKYSYKPPSSNSGSLWPGNSVRSGMLFQDRKARYLGDTVTIIVSEDISAVGKANTNSDASNENSYSIPYIFGQKGVNYHNRDWSNFLKTQRTNKFKGSGTTSRSNKMKATLTGQVIEVLPNGNLRIAAKKFMTINGEQQYILLTGIIRPEDIASDNIVYSKNIADAQIEYNGKGILSRSQKTGWASILLSILWPF
jgi:flagellar L-ring protein precursor FlgH